jgi:hypothetical protein
MGDPFASAIADRTSLMVVGLLTREAGGKVRLGSCLEQLRAGRTRPTGVKQPGKHRRRRARPRVEIGGSVPRRHDARCGGDEPMALGADCDQHDVAPSGCRRHRMSVAGYALVGADEHYDGPRMHPGESVHQRPRDLTLLRTWRECAADLLRRLADVMTQGAVAVDFIEREEGPRAGDTPFEQDRVGQRPVGAYRSGGDLARGRDRSSRLLIGDPGVLNRTEFQPGQLLVEEPRHLYRIGEDVTVPIGSDEQSGGSCLAARVDPIATAGGQPRDVVMGREEDTPKPRLARCPNQSLLLVVDLSRPTGAQDPSVAKAWYSRSTASGFAAPPTISRR